MLVGLFPRMEVDKREEGGDEVDFADGGDEDEDEDDALSIGDEEEEDDGRGAYEKVGDGGRWNNLLTFLAIVIIFSLVKASLLCSETNFAMTGVSGEELNLILLGDGVVFDLFLTCVFGDGVLS